MTRWLLVLLLTIWVVTPAHAQGSGKRVLENLASIPVYDKNRLASTILQKMVLEMAGIVPPRGPVHLVANNVGPKFAQKVDCMIGEKQRDDFMKVIGF